MLYLGMVWSWLTYCKNHFTGTT